MRSRLDDLIATADRQLASRSFDAAVDTYQTALNEPGAPGAGVKQRLEAARRARDEARGIVRPVETPAPIQIAEEPVPVPAVEAAIATAPAPPPPAPVIDQQPIEPPSFALLEPEVYPYEEPQPHRRDLDVEPLSILDPTPPPAETPNEQQMTRIIVAALIAIGVIALAYSLK